MPYKQNFINWISTARPSPRFLNITKLHKKRYQILTADNVYMKELLIDWNFHIKSKQKSLEGCNPNFNFHVQQNLTKLTPTYAWL